MRLQRTLRRSIDCRGIGLHTGRPVHLTLSPAPPDTGIVWRRKDVAGFQRCAGVEDVGEVDYATTLTWDEARIGTVEHLLSALRGLEVDNVNVEIDAEELPILDGSAAPFVYLIHEAGIRRQSRPCRMIRIRRPLEVTDGDRRLALYPHETCKVTYSIEFDHPAIGCQEASWEMSPGIYQEQIAPARTFGFLREVEALRKAGLARGGSLDNAIVLGDHEVLNAPLRFEDEFVRHKILDLVGDVSLIGMPILGHFVAHKGGHGLHTALIAKLREEIDAHEILVGSEAESKASAPMLAPLSPRTLALGRI